MVVPAPTKPVVDGKTHHTQTLLPDTVSRRRRIPVMPVVACVGAMLVAAGGALIYLRQHPADKSMEEATPPPEQQTQAEPPRPDPKPQPVKLKVLSEPAGALVVVDGKHFGETPMDLPLAPDAPPVTLALKLDGYEPVSQRVSAGNAPEVSVKLTPKPTIQKPPRRTGPLLDIKKGR